MNRDYTYQGYTRTLCHICKKPIDGKIVYNKQGVFIQKICPECGESMVLLEEDYEYHLKKHHFDKPGTESSVQTTVDKGCPYDCGLCPSHDQHSCIGLIEVTKRCNLECSTCFAYGGEGKDLSLDQIENMMDFYIEAEDGKAEILQISGGEPTLHPDILEIIQMAKKKGIQYVMLNTNGIRIAEEEAFAEALGNFRGGFEVYLQFDGLDDDVYMKMRGKKLAGIKEKAITNLMKWNVPVTLVCTVDKDINDDLLGEILVYGMERDGVRGVNFQPVRFFGRVDDRRWQERVTLSGILTRIEKQTKKMIQRDDFMPLPCNVERVAISYLFREDNGFTPILRGKDMSFYKDHISNTFMFRVEDTLKELQEAGAGFVRCSCCDLVGEVKRYLPPGFLMKSKEKKMAFIDRNIFRISVSAFIDIYDFDMKSMQKECVHMITPDLKRIPFSSYNMLHRHRYDSFYQ